MAALKDLAAPSLQDLKIPAALQSQGMPSHLSAPQGEDIAPPQKQVATEEKPVQKPTETPIQDRPPVETPEPVQTEPEVQAPVTEADPWESLKERFKDRLPTEVLDEYETLKREREDFRIKAEEREIAARELQEKLVAYDPIHDPEFQRYAITPVKEAEDTILQLFGGDAASSREAAKEAFRINSNKELDPKERTLRLKAFLEENGVTHLEFINSTRALQKATAQAEAYQANYKEIRAQKDQERLKAMEMQAQQNQANIRQVHRTAAFKAEAELKKLGVDYVTGIEDVRNEHMLGLEKALSGAGYDQEQEVIHNLLGRLFLKNHASIQAQLKELADLKAAARSKPSDAPRETKKPSNEVGDLKSLQTKIFGKA